MIDLIRDAQRVLDELGAWPSFHDAEILSVVLEHSGEDGPSLDLRVRVGSGSATVDERGYLVPSRRAVVALRFADIDGLDVLGFSHQNVIFELSLTPIDPGSANGRAIHVEVTTSSTCELTLNCRSIRVVSVE